MRQFDSIGLQLAKTQGKIFSSSTEEQYSSQIFIRRYCLSNYVKSLDNLSFLYGSSIDPFKSLDEQYGPTSYGKVKYPKEILYWIGYLYRYWSYTRELPTKVIYHIVNGQDLYNRYKIFHTYDPEKAIQKILLEKDHKDFDNSYEALKAELKKMMIANKFIDS